MARTRTSKTDPLKIAEIAYPGGGVVGVTFLPGKIQPHGWTGAWRRDLSTDIEAVRRWGASQVVTLVEDAELTEYGVPGLGNAVMAAGIRWFHLPIPDATAPDAAWGEAWADVSGVVHAELRAGGRVMVHCRGGLGRAGTVAARILIEAGVEPRAAILLVREARSGAIETASQEAYLLALAKGPAPARTLKRADAGSRADRALGAFLGLAVGDALGTTLEFSARDSHALHTEMTGGGPFRLKPGVWTDDTQMALALADSLAQCGGLDERDLMDRFVAWYRRGQYSPTGRCFDIGITTRQALARFERTGDPVAGSIDPMTAGNGCLMRLSPVAIFHGDDEDAAAEAAARQSATTHGAPECLQASAHFARMLVRAIAGTSKAEVLATVRAGGGKVDAIAARAWKTKTRTQIRSNGYVIDSLEAALWAVGRTNTFEEALVLAVNLGDDADTVGAITGQLAGAIYGASAIPERWMRPLAWRDRLEAAAAALFPAQAYQRPMK